MYNKLLIVFLKKSSDVMLYVIVIMVTKYDKGITAVTD